MAVAKRLKIEQYKGVVLTLTEEEAQTLLDVTRLVGGNMQQSRRRDTNRIGMALQGAGYDSNSNIKDLTGSLYFDE